MATILSGFQIAFRLYTIWHLDCFQTSKYWSRSLFFINVTDKVLDFVEVSCYALNCILMLFLKPNVLPEESGQSKSETFYLDARSAV